MTGDIVGFFHVGVMGRWREIFESQLASIKESGLYERTARIYIGVSGDQPQDVFNEEKMFVCCVENRLRYGETKTIRFLHDFCCESEQNMKVWYIHTKGARYTDDCDHHMIPAVDSWRKYLEHFVIWKNEECEKLLEDYDACGTEFSNKGFFSGNFWWANSTYIKRINLRSEWLVGHSLGMWKSFRHVAERNFVGLGDPRIFNFKTIYQESRDAYTKVIEESQYASL